MTVLNLAKARPSRRTDDVVSLLANIGGNAYMRVCKVTTSPHEQLYLMRTVRDFMSIMIEELAHENVIGVKGE